jgi:alpha-1,6-mannosyltransferase
MLRQKPADYLLVAVSLIAYYFLGYRIARHDTLPLLTLVAILFLTYGWVLKRSSEHSITFWILISLVLRAMLLFALPQLSDDFYRFIWDGRLWASGHHPFAALPSSYLEMNIPGVDLELYNHLNSKEYFGVYPPIAQFIFWISVKISPASIPGSVIVMRLSVLLAEAGSILLISSLLKKFNLSAKNVLYYALNPMIILELTGNLHLEAFVIFFLLLTVYFLTLQRVQLAAASISVAICTKLLPLIFLPAFIGRMTIQQLLQFFIIVALTCLMIFLPFLDWEVINSLRSVGLYFHKFEFNASIYYLVREFGYTVYGYNIIQTVGWKLALLVFVLIFTFIWIRNRQFQSKQIVRDNKSMFAEWMWMLFIYLLFTTTLHPWYISTLFMFSVFTSYRFVAVWTGMIFLTYAGYSQDAFHEVLWLTSLEYVTVLGYLGYELWMQRSTLHVPWRKGKML